MSTDPKPTEAVRALKAMEHLLKSIQTELRGLRKDLKTHFHIQVEEEAKSMLKGSLGAPAAEATSQYLKGLTDVPPPSEELRARIREDVAKITGKIVGRDDF